MLRYLLVIGAAAAFAPRTRPPPRQSALHAETQAPSWKALRPRPGDVVVIDGDNCRGKSKWRLSAADVDAAAAAAHARGLLGQETILMLDHGERRDCFVTEPGAYATAFAGRRATADDAIVDCVEHFLEHNRTLTVVTSDFGLRARASYVAARAIRGAPEGGRRRSPETLVRFARSEAFADAALADATIKPGAHAAAFDEAVDRLAKHVLTAPSSMRARMRRRARPPLVEGSPLGNEQTWMRVVLAERLRWLLARDAAAPRGPQSGYDRSAPQAGGGAGGRALAGRRAEPTGALRGTAAGLVRVCAREAREGAPARPGVRPWRPQGVVGDVAVESSPRVGAVCADPPATASRVRVPGRTGTLGLRDYGLLGLSGV